MKNKELIQEWIDFAGMDFLTARHLYGHMNPKPLEIICYHCQQSVHRKAVERCLDFERRDDQKDACLHSRFHFAAFTASSSS